MTKAAWKQYAPSMQHHEIAEAFRGEYGDSRNIMTPGLVKLGKKHQYLYEVSTGTGFHGEQIWGFTVLEINPDGSITRAYNKSQCCHSETEINECIAKLGQDL